MKRREFLKTFSAAMIGAGILKPHRIAALSENAGSTLAVAKGSDPSLITASVINTLGGMKSFISRGDLVVIKPNMAWDRRPEQAANTNPSVVAELVKLSYEAGAKKVKVFDNPCNSARRVYKNSGIARSARKAGADVIFTEERKFKNARIGGEVLKDWPVYKEALEADKLINVPIAKHHSLTGLTMGMKNLMGIIGGSRNLLHQKIDINIADLAGFFNPTLVVLDAVRILTANGPQGGNLKDVRILNTVAASTDQVAIDAFGSTLFGLAGDALGYVREANARGLGELNLSKVNIIERII